MGTGEFTDSLIWEPHIPISENLIQLFARQDGMVLEQKTKTVNVSHLKEIRHNRKTIVSWSLNPSAVIAAEERGTATLAARLKAAEMCQSWGYPLAFHFDPLVIYDGCEDEYRRTIQRLFAVVKPDNIVWISLGTFRFMPALKPIITRRFPLSWIIYGEFVRGLDGNMRCQRQG